VVAGTGGALVLTRDVRHFWSPLGAQSEGRTTSQQPPIGGPRRASIARSIHSPFGASAYYTMARLGWGDVDPLTSEETRVERTAAGSEHRESGAHRRELEIGPGLGGMSDGQAQLCHSNQRAGERCPQPDQQRDCGPG